MVNEIMARIWRSINRKRYLLQDQDDCIQQLVKLADVVNIHRVE
jgi:hypothetical protein